MRVAGECCVLLTDVGPISYRERQIGGRGSSHRVLGDHMTKLPSVVVALLLALMAGLVTVGVSPAGAVARVDEECRRTRPVATTWTRCVTTT